MLTLSGLLVIFYPVRSKISGMICQSALCDFMEAHACLGLVDILSRSIINSFVTITLHNCLNFQPGIKGSQRTKEFLLQPFTNGHMGIGQNAYD